MNNGLKWIKVFLVVSIPLLLSVFYSCNWKDEEQIFITSNVPDRIKLGSKDTLNFIIKTHHSLDTVKMIEENRVYATFDNRIFGKNQLSWEVNLIYNPATSGVKNLVFFVRAGGIYIKRHSFTIVVD